jgi:hypothetical protein
MLSQIVVERLALRAVGVNGSRVISSSHVSPDCVEQQTRLPQRVSPAERNARSCPFDFRISNTLGNEF